MLRRLALAVPLLAMACGTDPVSTGDASPRGPLGKADAAGSCLDDAGDDFCGGKSDGACWCDDLCTSFGDCCSDYTPVCEAEVCPPVACDLLCENGFVTSEDGCQICECAPAFCGGIAGFPCPDGLVCVDNPDDDCDPNAGGADCGGICVPPTACTPAECGPGPAAPNVLCDDGETVGGPACVNLDDGSCGWVFVECPDVGGTCEGHCGSSADGCWCDDLCTSYGDCCDDYQAECLTPAGAECGDIVCDADEVCVTHVTQLGLQPACAPISPACNGVASCNCMGADVCQGAFDLCGEGIEGGLTCSCPVC
jgi:hypothetical protein